MDNGIAGIDHVIVGVRNLERARLGWMRLGFTLTPRGRHIGQGTANYCIMFRRDYIELLGFVERDEYGHRLESFLAKREGPMSVAFAPARNAGATREALLGIGLHPGEPRALGPGARAAGRRGGAALHAADRAAGGNSSARLLCLRPSDP